MLMQAPAKNCSKGSRFIKNITTVRRMLDARYPLQGKKRQELNDAVTITGIGFLDRLHDQEGAAPDGIELHPVLSIAFDK